MGPGRTRSSRCSAPSGPTSTRRPSWPGESTPTFFGSALTNFGVRLLLDAVVDLAPAPAPRLDVEGTPRPLDAPFSGFVFKIQANMDPSHRDRIAFLRVCSGPLRARHRR